MQYHLNTVQLHLTKLSTFKKLKYQIHLIQATLANQYMLQRGILNINTTEFNNMSTICRNIPHDNVGYKKTNSSSDFLDNYY